MSVRGSRVRCVILTCVLLGWLSGCGGIKVKGDTENDHIETVETTVGASTVPLVGLEQRFLAKAEAALAKGRLTFPAEDNAYDRFQAVLIIDPNNAAARAGLQVILIQYAEKVRKAMAASQPAQARNLLAEAESYYPQSRLLDSLTKELVAIQPIARRQSSLPAHEGRAIETFNVPVEWLKSDKQAVLPLLGGIARRIAVTQESIMIYARTDAEGRWIYKHIKKEAAGYRVRGDIRLSSKVKIVILPPF